VDVVIVQQKRRAMSGCGNCSTEEKSSEWMWKCSTEEKSNEWMWKCSTERIAMSGCGNVLQRE
jgi:hypothetical protein